MAKCERCGASFDYDERQGVCPRCCFYNRPPGAARQDTEWMKYYNVEDNSYQLPKTEGLEDLFPERGSRWKRPRRDRGQDTGAGAERRSGDGQSASGGAKQSRRHTDYRQVMRKKYRSHRDAAKREKGSLSERLSRRWCFFVLSLWQSPPFFRSQRSMNGSFHFI